MITTAGMEEMVTSLAIGIPVAADGDDYQFRIGNLGAYGRWNRSAVQRVEHVAPSIVG